MTTPKTSSPVAENVAEPRARRALSQGLVAAIGLAAAIILAGGAFAVWALTAPASAETAAAAPTATSTSVPDAAPTAAPIAVPQNPPGITNHYFQSQSGNIQCSVGTFTGHPGAICHQNTMNYSIPSGACIAGEDSEFGATVGIYVGVGPEGAYWPCVYSWPDSSETIGYDTPVTQDGVTCSINYDTGVTCTNEAGKGFTMEYDAGISTF